MLNTADIILVISVIHFVYINKLGLHHCCLVRLSLSKLLSSLWLELQLNVCVCTTKWKPLNVFALNSIHYNKCRLHRRRVLGCHGSSCCQRRGLVEVLFPEEFSHLNANLAFPVPTVLFVLFYASNSFPYKKDEFLRRLQPPLWTTAIELVKKLHIYLGQKSTKFYTKSCPLPRSHPTGEGSCTLTSKGNSRRLWQAVCFKVRKVGITVM